MINKMPSPGYWKMLYLPKLYQIADGTNFMQCVADGMPTDDMAGGKPCEPIMCLKPLGEVTNHQALRVYVSKSIEIL